MSRCFAGALFPNLFLLFFSVFDIIHKNYNLNSQTSLKAEKKKLHLFFAVTAFTGAIVTPAANMICKKSIRCNIPLWLTHLNTVKRLTEKSCMSALAYQSALCISQNIHILKLAEPNEHHALIDDPIVVWRNLHNRYFT